VDVLFPHTAAAGIELRATAPSTGRQVYARLSALGLTGIPPEDEFAAGSLWPGRPFVEIPGRFTAERPAPPAHFSVVHSGDGREIGHAALCEVSPHAGHAKACVAVDTAAAGGALAAATVLTVNYAFAVWRLRKVYLWTTGRTVPGLADVPDAAVEEAVLPDHVLVGGERRPARVFAVYRERWDATGAPAAERLAAG
jgi:hypothetical protein